MLQSEEEAPWSMSLDLGNIKEEQEDLLNDSDEADYIRFSVTDVAVKSEDDEDGPQFSQSNQSPAEEKNEGEPPGLSSSSSAAASQLAGIRNLAHLILQTLFLQ